MIISSGKEQYEEYTKLADVLKKGWEKDVNSYLPKNEEAPPPVVEAPKTVEDEYASLSPEEIEAITGVRPEPKGSAPAAASDTKPDESASDDDIMRIMGMVNAPTAKHEEAPAPPASDSGMLSEAEIAALASKVAKQSSDAATTENAATPPAKKEEPPAEEMSAEDIWRQINGGK
jgi:hypothetical protein